MLVKPEERIRSYFKKSRCRFKCEAYIHVSKFSTNIFDLVLQNRIDFKYLTDL